MNCEQFRDVVHDVARKESLEFATIQEAREHAGRCAECDALLNEAEALNAGLRTLADRHAAEETPANVEVALLRSLRQMRAPVSRSSPAWGWGVAGSGAIAAAVLLIIVLTPHMKRPAPAASQAGHAAAAAALPADQLATSDEADASLTTGPFADSIDGWPDGFEGDTDTAAGSFVPLSEGFDPTSLDASAVVRVAMSRSALENLGVYLDGEESDGPVIADLVVSDNGIPQAIRVVSW